MKAFDYGLSTHKGTRKDFGLPDSNPFKLPMKEYRGEVPIPSGLVVSADDSICGTLGDLLLRCCVAPVFAETVREAAREIAEGNVSFVICEDKLRDGSYTDLLHVQDAKGLSVPLIVVSTSGDWPEYFQAVDRGAYDFLAYPLIPGELERIIGNFLRYPHPNGPVPSRLGPDHQNGGIDVGLAASPKLTLPGRRD
jgi:DNA-binding NtrC family response regulator